MGSSHDLRNVSSLFGKPASKAASPKYNYSGSLFGTVARPIQVIANKVNTVLNLEKLPGVIKKKPHK